MEEDDGAPSRRSSPPTPKKIKMESEEPKESLIKVKDHSEDESEEIEADDEEEDGSPQLPLLLDMIDLPPSSPLPPTPPLPSSPRDLYMEQQDSEDEGPPPGWDNLYQHKEQVGHIITPAAISAIPSDIKMEDMQEDARNGDGGAPDIVASDIKVEEQDSEDEGPPPGWDSKCQPEPNSQMACPTITQSDVQEDACNGDGPQQRLTISIPSDIKMEEQESEDEGPPPGWDSKCQPELQTPCQTPTITQSDIKTEDVQQEPQLTSPIPSDKKVEEHESEDEGPPPGWDSKPESTISQQDIKTEDIQNKDNPQPQNHTPTPQLLPSEIKVEEDEDVGPPPGWDSKFQSPNPKTPPLQCKIEDDQQEDDEGPPPGWGTTPTPTPTPPHQSPILPSGGGTARMECEENKNREGPKQQSLPPTPVKQLKPQMGQMVCGSCRRLLSYPIGVRYVECGCCLEENYVLQEDEVGQVICGGCDVLLMYPYGAPKVRCVNCSTETEIGDQNRRPTLSQQQQRARRHLKRVQTSKC
ncbi:hypothetical protein LXL04_027240 [Taraxacum kok-saghyz]